MLSFSDVQLKEVADILGSESYDNEAIESSVSALILDPVLARRLINCVPEAFGVVLISHMANVTLPVTFSVKNKRGKWIQVDLKREPIFERATCLAMQMFHEGPRSTFSNIVRRSALLGAANKALNAGKSLEGATLSGPKLIGIPAEIYLPPATSIWRRFLR